MGHGFLIRAARAGELTGFMPRGDRLFCRAAFRIVMRQKFRMRFDRLRKPRLQQPPYLQVILLARALQ